MASGSKYKRRLLERLGVDFETVASAVGESAADDESAEDTAKRLAAAKATDVAARRPGQYVLGADQTIELDGDRLRKPLSRDAAVDQLKRLSGRTHDLWCAVALAAPEYEPSVECVQFEMVMRELRDSTIASYVDEDEPLDCAGSYRIEAGGIRLFRAMRGDDYTAIIGLPLTRVRRLLERAGFFDHA